MKKYIFASALVAASFLNTSCEDFLNTYPHDALTPETTWQTEEDAEKFLIGCYSGWISDWTALTADNGSDIGFVFHIHEGWNRVANGSMGPTNEVVSFYSFNGIRNCNDFLTHIVDVPFNNESVKNDMIGQVKTMRAWQYFEMNWYYGGVPIIESFATAEEARVPRNTEEEVKKFIYDELDAAIPMLKADPVAGGTINRGVALAIKMRSALYYGDYDRVLDATKQIEALGMYDLEPSEPGTASGYRKLFLKDGQGSNEIILSMQHSATNADFSNWVIATFYNNADGGWSSSTPTQNLVDMYEMSNGLTKEEAGSGYDPEHPFCGRDPRMAATVIYPGQDWVDYDGYDVIVNTLDKVVDGEDNVNFPEKENNSSKTGLTWAKYLGTGANYYEDMWDYNDSEPILFRYAEVLLSYAEAYNEKNGPDETVYAALNRIRERAGMPEVDRTKYGTKETLRELIRRERTVELAGEGFRRADIVRWKDANGKMVAETVLNGPLKRYEGTVDYNEPDPTKRARFYYYEKDWIQYDENGNKIDLSPKTIENRTFESYNRYLPIPFSAIELNPQLKQNDGY